VGHVASSIFGSFSISISNYFFASTTKLTRKKTIAVPTHQTRQQWTAKDVEKNRVSFKIITKDNKNVIFIGFDGLFDLRRPQKSKKKH
jgi:hypothetical protein